MDASLPSKAKPLASEIVSQARTAEDLNGLMRFPGSQAAWEPNVG